jgi:hypothetical protein
MPLNVFNTAWATGSPNESQNPGCHEQVADKHQIEDRNRSCDSASNPNLFHP